jgi:hypothetical protein
MRDAVNSVLRGAYWVKLGARNPMHDRLGPCADWSMRDAVHPSRIMIIRIVFYKDRFDVYVTNAGNIAIMIVLNRRDVSGQDLRKDASCRHKINKIK